MSLPSGWRTYLPSVLIASSRYGVDPAIILAVIGTESSFDPRAYRAEPQINDASYGLMQLLMKTAKGLGFTGTTADLYDPLRNIELGTKLLNQLLNARGGDVDAAISAYNGGYRPSLGFGKRLPTGQFGNQAHVDRFNRWLVEARRALAPTPTTPPTGGPVVPPASGSPFPPLTGVALVIVSLITAWALWGRR